MSRHPMRILLALDPFEKHLRPPESEIREWRRWFSESGAYVEAVHVIPWDPEPSEAAEHHKKAFDRLQALIEDWGMDGWVNPSVIQDRFGGRNGAVETLVEVIGMRSIDLVMMASRGRRWVSRMVLGSFSERLLLESPVPVLFLGTRAIVTELPPTVLFPTDFSVSSRAAFEVFVEQVRTFGAEMLLLHVEQYPGLITGYSLTGVGAYLPEVYWKIQKESSISEGESWVEYAKKQGVRAKFLMEECGSAPEAVILRTAFDHGVRLIGVASVRSEFEKLILGSISTRLFRWSRMNVWVLGPGAYGAILAHSSPQTSPGASPAPPS
jgi:nucleotide-binding universal stress UspA family protein